MRKLFTLALFAAVTSLHVSAQQDAQFTQNMYNKLTVNPGYAGSSNAICATLLGRQQWTGFTGAPQKFLLNFDAPVKMLHGGAGLVVMQDQLGFEKTLTAQGIYSYRMPVGPGELGIGIGLGILNKSINGSWRAIDDYTLDPSIPNNGISTMTFDVNLGLYYNIADQLYFGISTTHLPASDLKKTAGSGATPGTVGNAFALNYSLARHYYIMAGYNYRLGDSPLELRPSVFVKTETSSTQLDLNCNLMYNKMVWGGLSYRISDAAAVLLGFQKDIGNGVARIGYSYDITTSSLRNHSSGSHEIMVGYCFKLAPPSKVERHGNVRFL
jgi:type IX secretion system PorP/SprF family membrane protein